MKEEEEKEETKGGGIKEKKGMFWKKPTLPDVRPLQWNSMPDEADRKRIVGCLAAVLAGMKDYDAPYHFHHGKSVLEESEHNQQRLHQRRVDALGAVVDDAEEEEGAYLMVNEEGEIQEEEEEEEEVEEEEVAAEVKAEKEAKCAEAGPVEREEEGEEGGDVSEKEKATKGRHLMREWSSFDATSSRALYDTTSRPNFSDEPPKQQQQQQQQTPKRQSASSTSRKSSRAVVTSPKPSSARKSAILAIDRHRARRHKVYSELLVESASYLLLDEHHARAFSPLLSRLQYPEPHPQPQHDNEQDLHHHEQNDNQDSKQTTSSPPTPDTETAITKEHEILTTDIHSKHDFNQHTEQHTSKPDQNAEHQLLRSWSQQDFEHPDSPPNTPTDMVPLDNNNNTNAEDEDVTMASQLPPDLPEDWIDNPQISPFLHSLTPGAGFRCITLLLLNHLLTSGRGYDARIRHALKKLGVVVLMHEFRLGTFVQEEDDHQNHDHYDNADSCHKNTNEEEEEDSAEVNDEEMEINILVGRATRKFEALERGVATKLILLSETQRHTQKESQQQQQQQQPDVPPRRPKSSRRPPPSKSPPPPSSSSNSLLRNGPTRDQLVRGLKIGTAGVIAGTLFAVTGGLAAPGIAAGIAAVTSGTAVAATAAVFTATLTSTAAVTAIFGVGGGGLAAYKMQRRTAGLTEFTFQKESGRNRNASSTENTNIEHRIDAELFSTICISGWLRDSRDFQRPWGAVPTNPPIVDRQELLERFYKIYKPENVPRCAKILSHWRGEERELWEVLKKKYGRDPNHLFPMTDVGDCPRWKASLTHEEHEVVHGLLQHLGYSLPHYFAQGKNGEEEEGGGTSQNINKESKGGLWKNRFRRGGKTTAHPSSTEPQQELTKDDDDDDDDDDDIDTTVGTTNGNDPQNQSSALLSRLDSQRPVKIETSNKRRGSFPTSSTEMTSQSSYITTSAAGAISPSPSMASLSKPTNSTEDNGDAKSANSNAAATPKATSDKEKPFKWPKHLSTVWDYQAHYGGEFYTVKWESSLLLQLCDSVTDLAVDALGNATKELLKQTVLGTLVSAIALPVYIMQGCNFIDGAWTLAIERADAAGIELARTLLESQAGHRPVTLVGFSMGARMIYSCLKELARHQETWEEQQELLKSRELARMAKRIKRAEKKQRKQQKNVDQEDENSNNTGGDLLADWNENDDANGNSGDANDEDNDYDDDDEEEEEDDNVDSEITYRREPASVVEDVIFMGMPNHVSLASWESCRRIVAGRVVNCYSKKDLMLTLMYQYKRFAIGRLRPVCGTCAIGVPGVENINISSIIPQHIDYCVSIGEILGWVRHGQPKSLSWRGETKEIKKKRSQPQKKTVNKSSSSSPEKKEDNVATTVLKAKSENNPETSTQVDGNDEELLSSPAADDNDASPLIMETSPNNSE